MLSKLTTCQIGTKNIKIVQDISNLAKVAKLCQIWSHCVPSPFHEQIRSEIFKSNIIGFHKSKTFIKIYASYRLSGIEVFAHQSLLYLKVRQSLMGSIDVFNIGKASLPTYLPTYLPMYNTTSVTRKNRQTSIKVVPK